MDRPPLVPNWGHFQASRRGSYIIVLSLLLLCLGLLARADSGGTDGTNTIVRFEVQRGTNALGRMDVELFDSEKPETVRNFLLYVRSGAYTNNFLHRCVPDFVVQGGGFSVTNPSGSASFSTYLQTANFGRLTNEFLTGSRMSNTLGTIAMAKLGNDPNSATSQWFFNLADNSDNLDAQNGGFTVFGRVLESTNASEGMAVLQHFNTLSTNAGIVDLSRLLGTNYQVFSSLPVSYTNTVTRVPQYRELYYVRISILNRTNPIGQSPPTISIVSPPANSLFTNQTVTVRGTASDDIEVARVVYQLQGGPLEIASGTTNWELAVSPRPGFNTVTVESLDWEGNYSPTGSIQFFYTRTFPLQLQIVGSGTVTGLTNGQILAAGGSYTGTATPAKGQVFDGWTGSITSTVPTLSFQVPLNATNFSLTAKFIPNPLPQLAGTYNGLVQSVGHPSLDSVGFMSMSLGTDGKFSGSILYQAVTYYYTGAFDSSGNASITGTMGGANRVIALQLQRTNSAGLITGTFSGTAYATSVQLERVASAVGTSNAPPLGRYTFAIAPASATPVNPLNPGGSGFGTGNLASGGTFSLSGSLGDGTTFSASPKLTRLGRWPVYVTLARGTGALAGWISYPTNQPGNLEASLQWIRSANVNATTYPGGFSNQVAFVAAPYVTPLTGSRLLNLAYGLSRLTGTDPTPGLVLSNTVKLSTNNTLEVMEPNAAMLKLTINVSSGSVTGSFVHPWFHTTNNLQGTVVEGWNLIRGRYVNGSQTGGLEMDAAPFLATQIVSSVTLPALTAAFKDGGLLKFDADGVVVLSNALAVQFDTALDANGHSVVISGGGTTRLVEVRTNLAFSASGITFADGFYSGANGVNGTPPTPGGDGSGAGILNLGGSVCLTNCLITNCVVRGGSGGLSLASQGTNAVGGRAVGGAICNRGGTVTLQTCLIADNMALAGRGGMLSTTGLVSKAAGTGLGAGLFSENGDCRDLGSTFLGNRAQGGAPSSSGGYSRAGNAAGGAVAIISGSLRLSNSRCLSNAAAGPSLVATNSGSGCGFGGALFVETNVVAVADQATFAGNSATGAEFDQSSEPASGQGGAIFSAGSLSLTGCTLEQNSALGGLSCPAGQGFGGAVASLGQIVVTRSTFNDNVAQGGSYPGTPTNAVPGGAGIGGAIYAKTGAAAITNSTFAYNQALGGSGKQPQGQPDAARGDGRGGALAMASNSVALVNVTVAFNEAAPGTSGDTNTGAGYGGGLANLSSTVKLRSSIVASNTPANLFGGLTDAGYNFSSDASLALTGSGSLTNVEVFIGPLTTNGGPTKTVAILVQSPAREAIRGDYPTIDQRGTARPQGTYADSGAFEFVQTLPIFSVQPSGTNVVRVGTNFTFQSSAFGPGPIGYSWLKDQSEIAGARSNNLTITNVQASAAGAYTAVASNSFGSVTSTVGTLVIDQRPFILKQPGDVVVDPGGSTSIVVTATGPGLGYTWSHNGVVISGAESPTLAIIGAVPDTKGTYQVIITNYAGAVTSRLASLTFSSAALSILTQPQSATVAEGALSSFNVLASGVTPIGYQWLRDSVPVPGATNMLLSFASTGRTNAGAYTAVVTNVYLSITSLPAILTVVGQPRLSISAQQTNLLVTCYGDPGRVHRLLQATNIASGPIWVSLATNSIPGSGSITWTQSAPANSHSGYYRAVTP